MTRHAVTTFSLLALLMLLADARAANAQGPSLIISKTTAQRHGLRRAWVTQVEVSRATDRVDNIVYYIADPPAAAKQPPGAPQGKEIEIVNPGAGPPAAGGAPAAAAKADGGTLFVQTRRGVLSAIDAQTGRSLWVTQVGDREKANEAPAVNEKYVAVVNGETLYVLDRRDGGLVFRKDLSDVASAGLAISKDWVFVPMISGQVTAYELPDIDLRSVPLSEAGPAAAEGRAKAEEPSLRKKKLRSQQREKYQAGRIATMNFRSFAPIILPPVVTRDRLAWTTRRGRIYIAQKDRPQVDNRFDALKGITAPLAYWPPLIYASSLDGYVYAVNELRGQAVWQFSVGEPMNRPPVPLGDAVLAIAKTGGMYSLDPGTGEQRWWAPGIRSFLAASAKRLYVVDASNAMQVLDRKSGARVDRLPVGRLDMRVMNPRSDRVFLGTSTGVLQCLHELGQDQPAVHRWPEDGLVLPVAPKAKQP